MNNILVPTDFSREAMNGLDIAVKIAKFHESEIFLVNMIQSPKGTFTATDDVFQKGEDEVLYLAKLQQVNKEKLEKMTSPYQKEGIKITPIIVVDGLQRGITISVANHSIDIVVMGTSGHRTFSEYFVGNNTEQVIRISDCPVIAVRKHIPDFKVTNIVLATDLDTRALEGVTHIKRFASNINATIHVLHVIVSEEGSPAEVNSRLESFVNRHHLANYTLNIVHNPDEEKGIMDFAREKDADMIAVITHGRSGLANLVLGSVTEDLVREANIPVMAVNMDD